jgi:hypothetical protein
MVIFNIIHPAKYLVIDSVGPKKNSIALNKIGVTEMPPVATEIAKRHEPIQHLELV